LKNARCAGNYQHGNNINEICITHSHTGLEASNSIHGDSLRKYGSFKHDLVGNFLV
jgi:hypothetical protein